MKEHQNLEVRSATREDANAITRLVVGFRDFLNRSEPTDSDLAASVNLWLRCQNTEVSIALLTGVAVGYATTLYQYSKR